MKRVSPGGLWDANNYEVKAIIKHNGSVMGETPLTVSEKANTFEGEVVVSEKGVYELMLYGYDPHTGNTGVDKATFIVTD